MPQVIEYLRKFNRKERFILLSQVLGPQADEVFRLSPRFRRKLAEELNLRIPKNAFVAMDYHLDWIQMALYLADQSDADLRDIIPNHDRELFEANQRDIDLLIAFHERGVSKPTHIVLIEAKADTGWNNRQLKKKAERLNRIFSTEHSYGEAVKPHFVLMSPRDPREKRGGIKAERWPYWMRSGEQPKHWLKLPLRDKLLKVTRCDERGNDDNDGDNLFISKSKNGQWIKLTSR